MKIGILALQGDYEKHGQILDKIGLDYSFVRYPSELKNMDGLIIPGGESTTLTNLMDRCKFHNAISGFAKSKPILGTCAGLIMMAMRVQDTLVNPLKILDIDVDRNAYGRQIHSFVEHLPVRLNGHIELIPATFIRAPKISRLGSEVEILAEYNNQPCAVKQGHHIGLVFHPELDGIQLFHKAAFMSRKSGQLKRESSNAA